MTKWKFRITINQPRVRKRNNFIRNGSWDFWYFSYRWFTVVWIISRLLSQSSRIVWSMFTRNLGRIIIFNCRRKSGLFAFVKLFCCCVERPSIFWLFSLRSWILNFWGWPWRQIVWMTFRSLRISCAWFCFIVCRFFTAIIRNISELSRIWKSNNLWPRLIINGI